VIFLLTPSAVVFWLAGRWAYNANLKRVAALLWTVTVVLCIALGVAIH
jgi:hypothetical protein